ncbi:MAG: prenyltransferase/squalene oxidase repeat-containing protein [Prosthecobacter sp.]
MNTNDPHQPTAYQVPPGWERFQPPPVAEPILQAVMVEDVAPLPQVRTSVWLRCWRQIGGGSLLLSLAVHFGLLLLAGVIIVGTQIAKKEVDFIPAGQTQASVKASQDLEYQVSMRQMSAMVRKVPQTRIGVEGPKDVSLPAGEVMILPEVGNGGVGGSRLIDIDISGPGLDGTASPAQIAKLPHLFGGRCSMQSRLEKLRENGGTPECEMAVSRSLGWLKGQQNADGSWGRANKAAMTGLTLLCYLGRCETPDSAFYGDNVRNGMLYLVELGRKNSEGIIAENVVSNSATYEHGIATYALGEMYSFYRLGNRSLPGLRDVFEKGVQLIIEQQNQQGSWAYGGKDAGLPTAYNKDSRGEDLSVSGWQFQALKAAKHSGLKIAGLNGAIKRCCDYLESKQTKDGGFGKTNRDEHYNQWSLTGCGVLGLQTLAHNKATPVKKGIRFLREFLTSEPLDWERNCNLYCWYYYTQAFFQAGADDWKFYNAQFLPQILGAQQADGSFKRGRPNWPAGDAADAIYRQCLCTLQLEVYFRYLKVADREERSIFEK